MPACLPAMFTPLARSLVVNCRNPTSTWPKYTSGPVTVVAGETWSAADNALHKGW